MKKTNNRSRALEKKKNWRNCIEKWLENSPRDFVGQNCKNCIEKWRKNSSRTVFWRKTGLKICRKIFAGDFFEREWKNCPKTFIKTIKNFFWGNKYKIVQKNREKIFWGIFPGENKNPVSKNNKKSILGNFSKKKKTEKNCTFWEEAQKSFDQFFGGK